MGRAPLLTKAHLNTSLLSSVHLSVHLCLSHAVIRTRLFELIFSPDIGLLYVHSHLIVVS
jgi:hypothetical protein